VGCNAPCLVSLYGSLVAFYVYVSTNFDDGSFVCEGFDVVDVCYGWVYYLGGFVCNDVLVHITFSCEKGEMWDGKARVYIHMVSGLSSFDLMACCFYLLCKLSE